MNEWLVVGGLLIETGLARTRPERGQRWLYGAALRGGPSLGRMATARTGGRAVVAFARARQERGGGRGRDCVAPGVFSGGGPGWRWRWSWR